MNRHWTFGRRLAAGFVVTVLLTLLTGGIGVVALTAVVAGKDQVIDSSVQGLVRAQQLRLTTEHRSSVARAYLLTGQERYATQLTTARTDFDAAVEQLRLVITGDQERSLMDQLVLSEHDYETALDAVVAARQTGTAVEKVGVMFEQTVAPLREVIEGQVTSLTALLEKDLKTKQSTASQRATTAISVVVAISLVSVLFGAASAALLKRALGRQVAGTVGHIQSSSAQLEAAATQQADGAREQATAMSEITTTIEELLITSRQIAEGSQRVAKIAAETASAAHSGDATIEQARESITAIRAQVDLIVQHMLELGQRSQQIGGVVDLVSELAEQTNILAINATIEASGAGEWGRRFAVVADEIRKLADRTAGSAKEIRTLIDDVRGAVNTTVMATETGAKAVDAGTRQFSAVTASFQQIADLVATTTESAREIELSTKQQTTAVEQVNIAVGDTARVTEESEASAVQTRQTAAHLSGLSSSLLRLVASGEARP